MCVGFFMVEVPETQTFITGGHEENRVEEAIIKFFKDVMDELREDEKPNEWRAEIYTLHHPGGNGSPTDNQCRALYDRRGELAALVIETRTDSNYVEVNYFQTGLKKIYDTD